MVNNQIAYITIACEKCELKIVLLISLIFAAGCNGATSTGPEPEPPPEENPNPPAVALGINVNGQYNLMKFENIDRTGTTWVRGFLDFFQLYLDESNTTTDPRIKNYIKLDNRGYKNILNIKWNFSNRSFPEPGSRQIQKYKSYLTKLLDAVWAHTKIIVVGNEPFIESKMEERGEKLVAFYKEIARHINDYRKKSDRNIPIYIGAFNNLYLDGWRTEAVNTLLGFADETDWISGIDLHIHHSGIEQINDFIDYANIRIRDNQKMLITEFSIKDHFRSNMQESISSAFADQYELDEEMKNYQYLDRTLKNNVSRKEWVDFLSGSPWFENRKSYLSNAYQRFKSYGKFHIATYALRQSYPFNKDFTANTTPWILNGLFANRTVRKDTAGGRDQTNYAWIDDFQSIQQKNLN